MFYCTLPSEPVTFFLSDLSCAMVALPTFSSGAPVPLEFPGVVTAVSPTSVWPCLMTEISQFARALFMAIRIRAEGIADPGWRRSYLTRNVENRRARALAEEWEVADPTAELRFEP
jgi:hypothetical protein